MNAIIDKLNNALNTDAVAIFTLKTSNHGFDVFATKNLNKKVLNCIDSNLNNNSFISSVMDNRKPLIISKIDEDEDEDFLKTLNSEGFTSYMGSPIILKGGRPIGVLTLYATKPKRYSRTEIDFINAISSQIGIALDRAQLIERMQEMSVESVRALVEAIEIRDPYTRGHSIRVADLSITLATALGFSERELELVEYAGLLHDVGKIAVPETILQKATKLTDQEWVKIKKHPEHSAKIIEPILNLRQIQNWILHHHERWDGYGYPSGRKGENIPIQSRIIAVCDTYSAMTEDRPYRPRLSRAETRREIKSVAGLQLDPDIVNIFLKLNIRESDEKFFANRRGFRRYVNHISEEIHTFKEGAGVVETQPPPKNEAK
jgi:putative nucleotidyltransferase with HDIG domain